MQIITTEFKGNRIHASSWLKSTSVPYSHALNLFENHKEAACQLVIKLNDDLLKDGCERLWRITAEGGLPCGKGYGFTIDLIQSK